MAHSQRGWSGARTPSAIKRVRQTERRRLINQPRRTAAKTLVAKALVAATDTASNGGSQADVQQAVERAVSALDRAAKIGAIHRNAADRRKSRLMLKVNAVLGGEGITAPSKVARTTGKAAAAKQAKARIAASRATKAKGAQTAAGKARAALAKTTRGDSADSAAPAQEPTEQAPAKSRSTSRSSATKTSAPKASGTKASATKASGTKASATKASAAKTPAAKPRATRSTTKKS